MRPVPALCLSLLTCAVFAPAQDGLPRHGVIGLQVAPGPGNTAVVQRVVEGSAGAEAGFETGDVIREIDGVRAASHIEFSRAVGRHPAGEPVRVSITRGGTPLTLTAVLKPRPYETRPEGEVLYRAVTVRGARRRVIVTRPNRPGRLPAVLLMQGLGCDSLDGIDRRTGYGAVLAAFEERGFVTMRVEKTGEGDSEGPLCTDPAATPELEAEGYVAGLRALKSYEFVDPQKVFVFAHSMGPVTGSLAIAQEPVRGFVAAETVGTSWFEYDLERFRAQHGLRALPDQVDREAREYEACSHKFYVEKQRPEELAATPGCENMTAPFGLVPYTYMQAVADISLGRQWKNADFPVLVIYGTASPVTTARQSQYLAELINRFHPGRATYAEVPGMGHDFGRYDSQKDFLDPAPGAEHPFHTGLMDVVLGWVDGQIAPQAAPASGLETLDFLVGEWTGSGQGQPGNASGGFTFAKDLDGKILVRRSRAEYPAANGRPAFVHSDFTVVFSTPAGLRASYFDNEGHYIPYRVDVAKGTVTFLSELEPGAPRYRLIYREEAGGLRVTFAIAPPGQPEVFKTYTDGLVTRSGHVK
jgi:pimeloyl-ACP methyl ester carboxylesterase